MVRQATSDHRLISELAGRVSALQDIQDMPRDNVASVLRLTSRASGNAGLGSAAFFAAGALIQSAESARLIDSPQGRRRVSAAYQEVADFSRAAVDTLGSIGPSDDVALSDAGQKLAGRVSRVSAFVAHVAKMAATSARRDLAASVTVRAKSFVRRSGIPSAAAVSVDPAAAAEAVAELDALASAANEFSNRVMDDGATPDVDGWLADFDRRMLSAVRKISPDAGSVGEAIGAWHGSLRQFHDNPADGSAKALAPEVLVELAPDQMRSELYETTEALRRVIPEVRAQVVKSSGLIDRSMFGHTSEALAALTLTDQVLSGAGLRVRRLTDPESLQRAWESRHLLKLLVTWTLEASAGKSRTTSRITNVLASASSRLTTPDTVFLRMEDLHELHGIIEDQNSENWVRAFVNRRMAVVYAQSALLLGEAIAVPFTWGGSAAAMPATLHAIVVGLQVAGKATLIVTSSMNISDRYVQDGVKGLVNPSSALDALTIVMLLPRPIPGPVDAQTWFGRALQATRNKAAGWMHEAGRFAVVGHAAFGTWQLAFAEHIAGTLRQQGYQATAAQVRMQALGHFGQAFLLGMVEWGEYRRGQALGGDHFDTVMRDNNPIQVIGRRLRNMVFPHEAAINTFNSLAPVIGRPLAGAAALVPAAGYLAYDYVIASEAMVYFYAGSDFSYFAHNRRNEDYPALADGESAVTFVGFDEADMLHAGSHSVDAHTVEREKYGDRYFVYDYASREDFLQKLAAHARAHGPVKYLRIMTHGLPGKLYTGDVATSAAVDDTNGANDTAQRDGWIDAGWLRKNGDRIRTLAGSAMAPGARAVLFACLVGANMDDAAPGIAADAGDDFLRAMGETLLHRGGLIDSSVRFLVGMDTVFGGLFNWSARDELMRSGSVVRQNPLLPLQLYRTGGDGRLVRDEALRDQMAGAIFSAASGEGIVAAGDNAGSDWAKGGEMFQFAVARMWRMLTQLHKLGIRYGIQLEGPWWSTPRYKHARVTPVPGGMGPDAVEIQITSF
jgi:hypothetical protein